MNMNMYNQGNYHKFVRLIYHSSSLKRLKILQGCSFPVKKVGVYLMNMNVYNQGNYHKFVRLIY
jgi:hypothetical protein